jgi:HEAT repeat protein
MARALLFEWGRQDHDPLAKSEALLALVEDGEPAAREILTRMAQSGGETGLRSASRLQDPSAIAQIAQRMSATKGDKRRDIDLLAATKSPLAIPHLVATLADRQPEFGPPNRAAAAMALGDFTGPNIADALMPLLKDESGPVRTAAAASLLKHGNFAGLSLLEDLAARPETSFRRAAARFLAPRPDERWMGLVRGLLVDPDSLARLEGAELIAPHDPAAARQTLMELANDPNPAIREDVEMARAGLPNATLTELRSLMREGKGRARVKAAAKVLEITR